MTKPSVMRQEFSTAVKLARWQHAKGRCENCGVKCRPDRKSKGAQYDHHIPDFQGGEATFENCRVLCYPCHSLKTAKGDAPAIAKSRRIRKVIANVRPQKRRGFRGSRKFNGDVVLYDTSDSSEE